VTRCGEVVREAVALLDPLLGALGLGLLFAFLGSPSAVVKHLAGFTCRGERRMSKQHMDQKTTRLHQSTPNE